jgi:hypothetical protein
MDTSLGRQAAVDGESSASGIAGGAAGIDAASAAAHDLRTSSSTVRGPLPAFSRLSAAVS